MMECFATGSRRAEVYLRLSNGWMFLGVSVSVYFVSLLIPRNIPILSYWAGFVVATAPTVPTEEE